MLLFVFDDLKSCFSMFSPGVTWSVPKSELLCLTAGHQQLRIGRLPVLQAGVQVIYCPLTLKHLYLKTMVP